MKSFQVTTIINATATTIWEILTDASQYPSWNPTVNKVEGRIAPGERVTVHPKLSASRAFPVRVTEFSPSKRMVWTGGMPLGLFKGQRVFTLHEQPGGTVEFKMNESFSGLLSPLIERSIPNLQPAFDEFAAALKRRAEANK